MGPTHPGTRVLSKLLALLKQQGKTREARELQAKFGGSHWQRQPQVR